MMLRLGSKLSSTVFTVKHTLVRPPSKEGSDVTQSNIFTIKAGELSPMGEEMCPSSWTI